jgi:AraC family transcriptional regulator, activator of mtrCDE
MNVFNRILEAIQIHYFKVDLRKVIKPVQLQGTYEQRDILIQANKGDYFAGEDYTLLPPGSFYFIPDGQPCNNKQGKSDKYDVFGREGFHTKEERELYVPSVSVFTDFTNVTDYYTILKFNVYIYDSISLFSILGIPSFILPPNPDLDFYIHKILTEEEENKTGKNTMTNTLTEQIVISLFRYIETQPRFLKYLEKIDYLLDKRLIKIIQYIHDNLDKDLSNKTIANLAYVSEDYVGQFFKSLTNKNLQEYVENQRLENALYLLRTRNDSIQEIAHQVGFKDPAYFSRRFKLKFGESANTIRRKENYLT